MLLINMLLIRRKGVVFVVGRLYLLCETPKTSLPPLAKHSQEPILRFNLKLIKTRCEPRINSFATTMLCHHHACSPHALPTWIDTKSLKFLYLARVFWHLASLIGVFILVPLIAFLYARFVKSGKNWCLIESQGESWKVMETFYSLEKSMFSWQSQGIYISLEYLCKQN